MKSQISFKYSNKGECQYSIGQKLSEFAPMNYEAKFAFNEKSLDIIIGLAQPDRAHLNADWLHINLFIYRNIPSIIITTGYIQVVGSIVVGNITNVNIEDWINGTDEYVNLVILDDFESYSVQEIRRIKLPLLKTIRNIVREQIGCFKGEIQNTLEIIEKGFPKPWMIYYTDEQCKYVNENSAILQTGTYIINEPKEKKVHVYF